MQIDSGRQAANGTTYDVTDPGWAADLVIAKLAGTQKGVLWTSDMAAASFRPATGTVALVTSGGITTHASGFTVGNAAEINPGSGNVDWIAVRDNGASDFVVGSYTGNGSTQTINHGVDVSGGGMLLIIPGGTRSMFWVTTTMTAANGQSFTGGLSTGRVTSFSGTSFALASSSEVNANTETYYYAVIKAVDELFNVLTYTGNGADNHTITGVGFQPENVWTKGTSGSTAPAFRAKAYVGDLASLLDSTSTGTARIKSLDADGMTLGTSGGTNTLDAVYNAAFFKDGETAAPTGGPAYYYAQLQ